MPIELKIIRSVPLDTDQRNRGISTTKTNVIATVVKVGTVHLNQVRGFVLNAKFLLFGVWVRRARRAGPPG